MGNSRSAAGLNPESAAEETSGLKLLMEEAFRDVKSPDRQTKNTETVPFLFGCSYGGWSTCRRNSFNAFDLKEQLQNVVKSRLKVKGT